MERKASSAKNALDSKSKKRPLKNGEMDISNTIINIMTLCITYLTFFDMCIISYHQLYFILINGFIFNYVIKYANNRIIKANIG
jgi:hypothetical protein